MDYLFGMGIQTKMALVFGAMLFLPVFGVVRAQSGSAAIDSMERQLKKHPEDTSKVGMLSRLAYMVWDNDVKKALAYEQQGYALSQRLHYDFGKARTAYQMAAAYMYLGDYPLADSNLTEAERFFTRTNDTSFLASILSERGDWHFMQGNYWSAGDYYARAAERFDRMKDTGNSLIAYQNLVAVLSETDDNERAVAISKKILPIAEKRKDSLQIGYTLQGLTTDLIGLRRMTEAAGYLPALIRIATTTTDNNLAGDSYRAIASYYYYLEQYAASIPYFQKSLEIAGRLHSEFAVSNANKSIGSAYLRLNKPELAKKYLDKAMTIAKKINNKHGQMNAAMALSEYFEKQRDFANAYLNLKRHLELKDSIADTKTRNYTRYLESKYEGEKKEKEILRLQEAEEQKDFEIRRRNIYIVVTAAISLALASIILLVRRNYRARQRLAEQQTRLREEKIVSMEKQQQVASLQAMINGQESERTRMARDLHDGLGGLFSTVKMHFSALRHDVEELKDNDRYKRTLELVESASEELRKIAHNMMPEVLMKLGLIEALRDLCGQINAGRLLDISLQAYGMERPLGSSVEVMIYRIIQELVNNILKHSSATQAIVQFNREGTRLSITVEDNGRGFDLVDARGQRNMGMETVQSRVAYLNGSLNIESKRDLGTTVMIELLLSE